MWCSGSLKVCGVYGAGSSCRYGTRRGACPVGRRITLPFWHPAGGLPSLSPVYPAFCLLSCPHPPTRARRALFPAGRGRFLLSYARGWTGRGTGSAGVGGARRGLARLVAGSTCRSGTRRGACRLCRLSTLPFAYFPAPIPQPLPGGKGEFLLSYARGFAPCIPRGWRGAALAWF